MGLFSHFKEQEQRLEALEDHVRALTESVQQTEIDLASGLVAIFALQAQIDEKVSTEDVDPAIREINELLGKAREQCQKASAAAAENWVKLQESVRESLTALRGSVEKARAKIAKA